MTESRMPLAQVLPAPVLLFLASLLASVASPSVQQPRGDVLIVIADDIGVEYLAAVPHPNMDALAARGVTYTAAFANPTCSPSRRSILFGRYFDHDSGSSAGTVAAIR